MSEASEIPRPRVMWWTRKFGEPLRQTFQVDDESADEFMDLLAQADSRLGVSSDRRDRSERA